MPSRRTAEAGHGRGRESAPADGAPPARAAENDSPARERGIGGEAAAPPAPPPGAAGTPAPHGRRARAPGGLTHPQKLLWPQDGISKQALADYLEAVAPRLLPAVADRVLTLIRAPRGLAGPRFVQRHPAAALGPAVLPAPVAGEAEPYLTLRDAAGLRALAQADVLEIHPTGATLADFAHPDRLVLDLDPAPDLAFADVVAAALELRARVQAAGLTPFCRTTGGKGLHLVVPLVPRLGWAETKAVARALCEAAAADAPGRYTTSPVRQQRAGRIFLDYLRNDRLATAIASWSPRARPGAPVATPLDWAEVVPGLDPAAFSLRDAAALLRRPDPWAGLAAAARPLTPALLRRLEA